MYDAHADSYFILNCSPGDTLVVEMLPFINLHGFVM